MSLEAGIVCRRFRMHAHEISKEQRKLLAEAARSSHMDMSAALSRSFSEIPLREIRVVRMEAIPEAFQRCPIGVKWIEVGDGDLDVDDRLGSKTRDGGRADVVNT